LALIWRREYDLGLDTQERVKRLRKSRPFYTIGSWLSNKLKSTKSGNAEHHD
jgi:hypothetical protein